MAQNNIPVSEYFSGQGNVLLAEIVGGVPQGYRHIGNVPELKFNIDQSVTEHKESTSGQRATDLRLTTETKVSFSITVEDLNIKNLNLVLYGTDTVTPGASVTGENVTVRNGFTVNLAHIGVSNVVIAGATEGTDYSVNSEVGSINFLPGGALTDGSVVTVDYDFASQTSVAALTQTRKEYAMRFEGLNTIDGKPVVVDTFRMTPDPLKELGLIQDDIASVPLEGSLLYSAQHPENPYYRVTKLS